MILEFNSPILPVPTPRPLAKVTNFRRVKAMNNENATGVGECHSDGGLGD